MYHCTQVQFMLNCTTNSKWDKKYVIQKNYILTRKSAFGKKKGPADEVLDEESFPLNKGLNLMCTILDYQRMHVLFSLMILSLCKCM